LPTKEILDQKLKECSATIERLNKRLELVVNNIAVADEIHKKCDQCQKTCDEVDRKLRQAYKDLTEKNKDLQAAESNISKQDALIGEQQKLYNQCIAETDNLLTEDFKQQNWKQNPSEFSNHLKKLSLEWTKNSTSLTDITKQIDDLQKIENECALIYAKLLKLKPEWKTLASGRLDIEFDKLTASFTAFEVSLTQKFSEKEKNCVTIDGLTAKIENFVNTFHRPISVERLSFLNQLADIKEIREQLRQIDEKVSSCAAVAKKQQEQWQSHLSKEDRPAEDVDESILQLRKASLLDEKKELVQKANEILVQLEMNAKGGERASQLKADLDEKTRTYLLWDGLARALGTTNADNFRDLAQSYTMRILLEQANVFMRQLSSRYLLCCEQDSMAIQVSDMDMGGEKRVVTSLSGGETFLVSLALALGLASLNAQGFNIDMLFIDEGFGTLDGESLDLAMSTLENLHALGRKVGIISHVETLKERIPAQIQLIRKNKSTSIVKVVKQ
jgi:ATPase involved in DNA repair